MNGYFQQENKNIGDNMSLPKWANGKKVTLAFRKARTK